MKIGGERDEPERREQRADRADGTRTRHEFLFHWTSASTTATAAKPSAGMTWHKKVTPKRAAASHRSRPVRSAYANTPRKSKPLVNARENEYSPARVEVMFPPSIV